MPDPNVSVIICVYNRSEQVMVCLESLLGMEYQDFEIVAVDDGSTDGSIVRLEAFQQSYPQVRMRVVRNPRNLGVSGARNAGIDAARGEIVAFADSDCTVETGWLGALVEPFADPGVSAVAGRVIDAEIRTLADRANAGTCTIERSTLQGRRLIGNNMAFRRSVLVVYRFDEALTYGCDEDDVAWRMQRDSHRIAFAPDAVVCHRHPMSLGSYLRVARRQGQGSARFWYKRGTYLGRDLIFPAAAVAVLPLALIEPMFLVASVAFLALHVAALGFNEVFFKGKRVFEALAVLPVCLLHSLGKGWGVVQVWGRLLSGGEEMIRRSKRAMRRRKGRGQDEWPGSLAEARMSPSGERM